MKLRTLVYALCLLVGNSCSRHQAGEHVQLNQSVGWAYYQCAGVEKCSGEFQGLFRGSDVSIYNADPLGGNLAALAGGDRILFAVPQGLPALHIDIGIRQLGDTNNEFRQWSVQLPFALDMHFLWNSNGVIYSTNELRARTIKLIRTSGAVSSRHSGVKRS